MLHWLLLCQVLLVLVNSSNDLPTLEQINRALEQPDDNRLVEPIVQIDPPALEAPQGVVVAPENVVYATPTVDDGELLVLLQGKIEGAPEKKVETSFVKRKPAKNTTIWTTVTPPTACSSDGCCPEDVTTLFVTATVTSEDLFVYTVTETIDVTVFRGETVLETVHTTSTDTLILTSTVKREATVTTTSFLTTSVPISRLFIRTSRVLTPGIRTVFRNTSTTSTRFATVTETIITTTRDAGDATITDTTFVNTRFFTDFITFTQTVFNPLTIVDFTIFTFSKTTRTVIFPSFTIVSEVPQTLRFTISDPVSFTITSTYITLTLTSVSFVVTTEVNVIDSLPILTTETYSRLF